MQVYIYRPFPDGIDRDWNSALEVFYYLLNRKSERSRVIRAIHNLRPTQAHNVKIWHEQAPGPLQFSTVEDDNAFLRHLKICITNERLRQNQYYQRNKTPPKLPDLAWDERLAAYPERRQPVTHCLQPPSPLFAPKNPRMSVSTQQLHNTGGKVLTVLQDLDNNNRQDKDRDERRGKELSITESGPDDWNTPEDVYQFLLKYDRLRRCILERASELHAGPHSVVALTHPAFRSPIILEYMTSDACFCYELVMRLN